MAQDDDEDVPLLDDIVRPGNPAPKDHEGRVTLTEEEIEAIAARVVERHTGKIEAAVTRAIEAALDLKARQHRESGSR